MSLPTGDALSQALSLTFIEFVGDYGAKVQNPLLAYGGYNALAWKLSDALKDNSLILTNSYWDAMSSLMTVGLGLALGERPSGKQLAGVGLIVLGMVLLGG